MGKYSKYRVESQRDRAWDIHPIWRGIGCLMFILMPIMAYAGADLLVDANIREKWILLPSPLMQTVTVPYIGFVPHLYAKLIAAVLLSLLGFALLTMIFGVFSSAIGAPRYGPTDSPPIRYKKRRR